MKEHAMPADAELVAGLNDLLQLDHDAVGAYTLAIQALPGDAYRQALTGFREEHERHIGELSELIRGRGGVPLQLPHLPTGAFKLAVQALGGLGEDRAVLLAFKTNEWQVRDRYRRYAAGTLPPEVQEVVRRATADEEKHYRWAEEALARLGAGPDTLTGLAQQAAEQVHGRAADLVEGAERRVMEAAERLRRGG